MRQPRTYTFMLWELPYLQQTVIRVNKHMVPIQYQMIQMPNVEESKFKYSNDVTPSIRPQYAEISYINPYPLNY